MISKRLILLLLVLSACKPAVKPPASSKGGEPKVRATVVSIRTTLEPARTAHAAQIVIGPTGVVRHTGERDVWRLFDTQKKTVTTVDDVSRTYSTEPLDVLVKRQRAVLRARVPSAMPRLDYRLTGETRAILGVTAQQALATAGAYRRELWLASHPAIPPGLFRMMQASTPPSSPLIPAAAEIETALLELDAFPLIDRFELPFGEGQKFAAEVVVTSVDPRDVPQSVLAIPRDYKDVTPKPPEPAKKR